MRCSSTGPNSLSRSSRYPARAARSSSCSTARETNPLSPRWPTCSSTRAASSSSTLTDHLRTAMVRSYQSRNRSCALAATSPALVEDGNEAAWLDVLAEFDKHQGWNVDGQLSGADWLVW